MKIEFNVDTVDDIANAISDLISKGEKLAEETGKHFWANGEEYIPTTSDEWEDYDWLREDNCLPDDQGFWRNSSMSC